MRSDITGNLPPGLDFDSAPGADEKTRLYNLVKSGDWRLDTIISDSQGSNEADTWAGHPVVGDVKHLDEKAIDGAWVTANEVDYDESDF